ncbi:fumarate reductase flavoprotein subunit [Neorhizobium galegae]|uniref:FAD-dependent oxidoreductase n=1 Tax=Neorhizobium galegae TaxID=399 RepID=UPI001AE1A215|nr:FAD-dependent oxidoreductase [Neorhizobium galegae]MBP2551454.1 fumarate reductase flavoprotein subunit [Neorhizobium galegae]
MSGLDRSAVAFDVEFPVVVVGAGAAGLTAALAARDAGAEVLLLERDETPRGSTSMSQGYVCAAGSKIQRAAGIEDDAERFYADIMARTRGTANPDLARTVSDNAGRAIDWLVENHKIPFEMNLTWGGFFGHSVNRMHGVPSKRGEELHGALIRAAEEAGVNLVTGAHVDKVFADETNTVVGVRVRRADGSEELVGCQTLVLTTCGFGANLEMVKTYIPSFGQAANYRYFGHEGNEGEGIEWGRDLGAALGSMDAFQGYGALTEPYGIIANYDMVMNGAVTVNIEGKRFSNENADISAQALNILAQPEGTGWIIFDDARRAIVENLPEFRDLVTLGGVRTASDADQLAALIRVPPDALKETLAEVEKMTRGEMACTFGRDFSKSAPLSGTLHALKTTGALFHTQGGLKVNSKAQVIRADGTPLPNLFAGGGTAESISGTGCNGYLPAAGLCMAVTLGMLAGASAAELAASA